MKKNEQIGKLVLEIVSIVQIVLYFLNW